VGYLPEADLVFKNTVTANSVSEADLTQFCEGKLPEYAIPRFWNILKEIPAADSLKSEIL
jgi:acyl-CoA synthetase (AMP-forming)/AMP-acid ligase II